MNRQIYEEAAEWLVELREANLDAAAREKLDAWFRASPQHIRAFLELSSVWEAAADRNLDRCREVADLLALARGPANVATLSPERGVPARRGTAADTSSESIIPDLPVPPRRPPAHLHGSRHNFRRATPAAGGLLACIVLAAFLIHRAGFQTYSTGIDQQRTVALADGSTVELAARSSVRVHFSRSERDVELLEGQALFKVAKNPQRPFVVTSDSTHVRAVGTEFDVDRQASGTTVTVVEGRVAVFQTLASAGRTAVESAARGTLGSVELSPIFVSAGEQVTVATAHIGKPIRTDVAVATAWRRGQLVFEGAPLTEVVDVFNRYSAKPLILSGPAPDFRVTGIFSSTNPASVLEFLRAQRDLTVEETSTAFIISKR